MPFSSSRKTKQYLLYFYKQRNIKLHKFKKKIVNWVYVLTITVLAQRQWDCIRLTYASNLNKNTVSDNMVYLSVLSLSLDTII